MSLDNESDLYVIEDDDDEEESQAWLATFADLSMLLLVFFILLYSMSTLDVTKFSDTFTSVTQALQGKQTKIATSRVTRDEAGVLIDQVLMRRQIIQSQRKVYTDIKTLQTRKGVEGLISANFEDGLITLRVPGDVLFGKGQVKLTAEGKRLVKTLKDFFVQHPDQKINIKGFTDNTKPRSGGRFKDNWEISSLRAVNVLRTLIAMGINPNRLTATGLADLQPLYPNTAEEYRKKNRRVEFVLEKRVVKGQ
ncbi:MAG: OmpA/MotB family protein [Desulfovibrio sp.]